MSKSSPSASTQNEQSDDLRQRAIQVENDENVYHIEFIK